MILPVEAWMDLRRYQPLRDAGATWREIADEVGLDWRTVKRYLSTDAPSGPPARRRRRGCVARKIDAAGSGGRRLARRRSAVEGQRDP